MVALPPDDLKAIRAPIHRGNQMSTVDQVITYYCYYFAMSQALEKKLHTKNDECKAYMLTLMDETEARKQQLADNELITDDMAAQAYVENFGLKVFANANNAVEGRTATQKTSDSLQAAATFLDLTKIFGEQDQEIAKKIKYAKFHAARILKALKEGGDINLPPASPAVETPPADSHPPPPTLEEVPDDFYSAERRPSAPASLHASRPASSAGRPTSLPQPPPNVSSSIDLTSPSPQPEVSPLLRPSSPPKDASYFPSVPSIHSPGPSNPTPPAFNPASLPDIHSFSDSHYPTPPVTHQAHQPLPPPQPPQIPYYTPQHAPQPQAPFHQPVLPQAQVPPPARHQPGKQITPEDIAKAQKFAKWAVSALDYEDIENAIEQFRKGLECLGAS